MQLKARRLQITYKYKTYLKVKGFKTRFFFLNLLEFRPCRWPSPYFKVGWTLDGLLTNIIGRKA